MPKSTRRNFYLPDALFREMAKAAGRQSSEQKRPVSTASWLREAIQAKLWREDRSSRAAAHKAVADAIASGKIIRSAACEVCGSGRETVAHHHSYARRDWLKVHFICSSCHSNVHVLRDRGLSWDDCVHVLTLAVADAEKGSGR